MKNLELYSRLSDHKTVFEIWGSSTKHPDVSFNFSNFNKSPFGDDEFQIFAWLLECASKMVFASSCYRIADFAMELRNNLETR